MKLETFLTISLLALLPSACEKGNFADSKVSSDSYEVMVEDPQTGDSMAGGTDESSAGDPQIYSKKDDGTSGKGSDKTDKDDKDSDTDSSEDAKACATAAGLSLDNIKISGSQNAITLTPKNAFALKVSGNSNKVTLKLSTNTPLVRMPALCLFVTGNQSQVLLDINLTVGQIFVKARGNKALIEARVSKGAVIEKLNVDAKGHEPQIVLQGEGTYPCEAADSSVSCAK